MNCPTPFAAATPPVPNLISRSPLRRGFPVVLLVLGLFALSSTARAVSPPPDGGYPGNNTAEGDGALSSVQINATTGFGIDNTAIGFDALFSNTTGSFNTASGSQALFSNTSGLSNTAYGCQVLFSNTTGTGNTAIGTSALNLNTRGSQNTSTGHAALFNNRTGSFNTASGTQALYSNTSGLGNTANGSQALFYNTTGTFNTANGHDALSNNTTGIYNTANGVSALGLNTTGYKNVASGREALLSNTTGHDNTAQGNRALLNTSSGSFNIAIGSMAGANLTTGSNNIIIDHPGVTDDTKTIRIGTPGKQIATFVAGIRGMMTANANAVPVVIDSAGQLGTVSSSRRFKAEIKPMDNSSESLLGLKPVTFHYKRDTQNTPQFGLIAEEVAKVNPDLVIRDENGEIYTVRYEAVNAMLLNEVLKAHKKVEQQEGTIAQINATVSKQAATITQLTSMVAQQQKDFQAAAERQQEQIETLTAGLQKVSAQLELNKPAPQLTADNQ
jgi:uncharacterized coiled-coil protein SlyX